MAVVGAVVVGAEDGVLVVLAGQQAAGQRHAGDDADAGLAGRGQHLVERLEAERVQDDLDAATFGRAIAVSASAQVSTLTPYAAIRPSSTIVSSASNTASVE